MCVFYVFCSELVGIGEYVVIMGVESYYRFEIGCEVIVEEICNGDGGMFFYFFNGDVYVFKFVI